MLGAAVAGTSGVEIPRGDPGSLRHAGRQWAALADLLADQAIRVDGQGSLISTVSIADTSGGTWWGAASNAYRSYCSTLAGCLATGGDAFQTAAGAVRSFAHDLQHEQNNAKRAREAAMEALSDLRAAQQAHDEAGGRLTAANGAISVADGRAGAAALGGPLSHPQLEQARHDRSQAVAAASAAARDLRVAQARIETAERKLKRARELGEEANESAERAARTCGARLHDATDGMRSPDLLGAAPVPITTGGTTPALPGSGDPFKQPFHAPSPAEELERLREELAQEAEDERERMEGGAVDRFAGEFEGFLGVRPPFGIGDPDTKGYKDGKKLGNVASYFPTLASLWKQGAKPVIKKETKDAAEDAAAATARKAALDRLDDPQTLRGASTKEIDDTAKAAGYDIRPGSVTSKNPATRYYKPGTKGTEGFRVLHDGVPGHPGVKSGTYIRFFGGPNHGETVLLKGHPDL